MAEDERPPVSRYETALQKHAAFFDEDGDGIITLGETRRALRSLGIGRWKAPVLALGIHLGLARATSGKWLDIVIAELHRGIHESDTGVYDAQGRFVSEAFERLFRRFDKSGTGALNELEIAEMIEAHAKERPGGRTAAKLEFGLLLDVAADQKETVEGRTVRAISRERLRAFYDGSLFFVLTGKRPPWE